MSGLSTSVSHTDFALLQNLLDTQVYALLERNLDVFIHQETSEHYTMLSSVLNVG